MTPSRTEAASISTARRPTSPDGASIVVSRGDDWRAAGDPVKAGEGHVVGHADAVGAQGVKQREGELVVVAHDRLREIGCDRLGDRGGVAPPCGFPASMNRSGPSDTRASAACAAAGADPRRPGPGTDVGEPPVAPVYQVLDDRRDAGDVVRAHDAAFGWFIAGRKARIVGLHEDDPLGGGEGMDVGRLADAQRQDDAVRPMLDERAQCALLPLRVVQAGHDEHGETQVRGRLLETRRDLPVHGIGELVEQEAQDVRAPRAKAAGGGIRDVAELLGRGVDGRTRVGTDPRVILEGSRRGRRRCASDPGDIGEHDPSFRWSTHPADSAEIPMRYGIAQGDPPSPARRVGAHAPKDRCPPFVSRCSGDLCNRLRGR